jgi:hypothetical protein
MSEAVLTAPRSKTLAAVAARILPSDGGPGAAETAAATCCERALQHPSFAGLRPPLESVLDWLQAQAESRHATEFAACAPGAQDELLRALEQNPNPFMRFLFRWLVELGIEGFLCDPVHGGNRDFLGWSAVGLRAEDLRSGLCLGALDA